MHAEGDAIDSFDGDRLALGAQSFMADDEVLF
jgi:hypothetical protein